MRSILILAALAALPAVAGAQRPRTEDEKNSSTVPVSMLPPAGKCRIWMVGVAPAQQPAPTDCQTALRQRPENGVVIFGPVEREEGSSAFGSRPNPEQQNGTRRTTTSREPSTGSSRDGSGGTERPTVREPQREPATVREPTRQTAAPPARATTEPRRETTARPPSGTRRPTEDPTKKPPSERPPVEPQTVRPPTESSERPS